MARRQPPPRKRRTVGVDRPPDLRARLAALSPAKRALALATFGVEEADGFDREWPIWAHHGQLMPPGEWRTWVIMAGRGFGKTRAGSEWVAGMVRDRASGRAQGQSPSGAGGQSPSGDCPLEPGDCPLEPLRIALVGATIDDARRVMIEGPSGLIAVAGEEIAGWFPTRRLLRFASGAEATLFSGASPDALRGPEHHFAWCDELAKWEKPGETWDMLQLGLRLGAAPRALVTTTPRPGPVLTRIMEAAGCVKTGGPTVGNPHLPAAFVDAVHGMYAGTRLARQELEGELLSDVAGALWTVELLERCRVGAGAGESGAGESGTVPLRGPSPGFHTVIGVDPPAADGTCGIVACALDAAGMGHVLADHSVSDRSPEDWARAVAAAAEVHGASLVVAEANQGGRMVESVLRAAGVAARVKPVHAALSKADRADPVATLFQAGRVRMHGRWPELEAELCGLVAGGGYEGPGRSPDRADAMVWALTELMLGKEAAEPWVRVL